MTSGTWPEIVPIEIARFRFPDDEPLAGQDGVVMAYLVRHAAGLVLFDTGFGFGSAELDARYHPRTRRLDVALGGIGVAVAELTAVVNCHLHVDHAGQNGAVGDVPIHVQPDEWTASRATDYTIAEWIDAPGAQYVPVAGDHVIAPGIEVMATPGHTPGHQSLVVDGPDGPTVLVGQAVYSRGEWLGSTGAREGRTSAWDSRAYDRSIERIRALRPARLLFAHDRATWTP